MARDDAQFSVRLSLEDRDLLKELAAKNRRSMNSEIGLAISAWLKQSATTGESLATDPAVASNSAALPGGTHQP